MTGSWGETLKTADLLLDKVYVGGRNGNSSDDPLPKMFGVSNGGGFRYLGRWDQPKLILRTSSGREPDWPDNLDRETGILTYYGDNRSPGKDLHDTKRFGKLICAACLSAGTEQRCRERAFRLFWFLQKPVAFVMWNFWVLLFLARLTSHRTMTWLPSGNRGRESDFRTTRQN